MIQIMGGLGNQLFMFASALSLSRIWGTDLVLSSAWFEGRQRGQRFDAFRRQFLLHEFPEIAGHFPLASRLRQVSVRQLGRFENRTNLVPSRVLYFERRSGFNDVLVSQPSKNIIGTLQSLKYFSWNAEEIRSLLEPAPHRAEHYREFIRSLVDPSQRAVMIHVRREDTLVPGNEWTGLLNDEYYAGLMDYFSSHQSKFIVFSDSPAWCKRQEVFRHAIVIDEPSPVATLHLMSQCDDHILAGSTLSWWGAWLSRSEGKRVFLPWPFFQSGPEVLAEDLIPDSWRTWPARWT